MRVSITDIAAHCGVSRQTVSNALRGTGRLGQDKRQHIQTIAREMGYLPNSIARTMRTGRFGAAALLLPPGSGGYLPPGLVRGLMRVLEERDMHLTLAQLPDEKLADAGFVPKMLRELAVDGLLVDYLNRIPPRMLELIEGFNVPSVWINRKLKYNAVHPDDLGGMRLATEHLLSLGHRRIGYVQMLVRRDEPHYSYDDRRDGYVQAMTVAGLPQDVVTLDGGDLSALLSRLGSDDRPTALLAYGNDQATAAMVAAAMARLRVPEDLSLITVANFPPVIVKELTTVQLHQSHLGERTATMLLERISHPRTNLPSDAVALRLLNGGTTAPPPAA